MAFMDSEYLFGQIHIGLINTRVTVQRALYAVTVLVCSPATTTLSPYLSRISSYRTSLMGLKPLSARKI